MNLVKIMVFHGDLRWRDMPKEERAAVRDIYKKILRHQYDFDLVTTYTESQRDQIDTATKMAACHKVLESCRWI